MFENPFIPPKESYKRDINPTRDYIEQASFFLSRQKEIPYEEALAFVKKLTLNKQYPTVRFPQVHFLKRGENGDREPYCTSLLNYINDSIREQEIVAPTLTTYISDLKQKSILAVYIDNNITKRSKAKKAMFAAEAAKDKITELFEDGKQRNFKLSNNAISGAHASSSNPLYNPTSHSTLTSNCRMTSAFGNANNEKLLSGNRHYHHPAIVMNNIVSIVSHTDYKLLESVISKYRLYLPNTEDVMQCICYSSDLYWTDTQAIEEIRAWVDKLHPMEKAAFLYTGDLYHIKKHNENFVKIFIEKLAMKMTGTLDDPIKTIKEYPEDMAALAHQICADEMRGRGKDYKKMLEKGAITELNTVACTAKHIAEVIVEYEDFIRAIMVSDNVPASISHFPSSIRRAALTSDTDSTIFTVQDWVLWLNDGKWWGQQATAYGATLIFIASQAIIHILARMSVNNGISPELMYKIAMKNEFYFPVFVPTSVNKHYFASIGCQEGNVKEKFDREVKGVHLKNSNSPNFINKFAKELMNEIMDNVMEGKKLSLMYFIKKVADFEREIYKGVLAGETKYFRSGVIKQKDSYNSEPERSPYFHYMLWKEVFSPKYGEIEPPPYDIINVSTTLNNQNVLEQYLQSMEDQELSNRLRQFLEKHDRKNLNTIQIPVTALASSGMPKEIAGIINARGIVINLCKIFYLILETLGLNILNKKSTTLVSDFY